MTTAEAHAILCVNELLSEFRKSLRVEQITALTGIFDMSQKIILMELFDTVPPDDPAVLRLEPKETWTKLVRAAKALVEGAVGKA